MCAGGTATANSDPREGVRSGQLQHNVKEYVRGHESGDVVGIEPEKMRESSRHEHCEGDEVALATLVVQKREKPGKFLRPHGMILLFWAFRIFMEDNP